MGPFPDIHRMLRWIAYPLAFVACLLLLALSYGATGYFDARADAKELIRRADALLDAGRGAEDLGPGRSQLLLSIQDPGFYDHNGIDIASPGAGLTTVTQSLAKRVGFDDFRPGIQKLRQIGYAVGLESTLSKPQILALFLDTLEMGPGPDGWMTGFYQACDMVYHRPPAELSETEFLRLAAVMIAPAKYNLILPDAALVDRVERLRKLVSGQCSPEDLFDVWLDACARRS